MMKCENCIKLNKYYIGLFVLVISILLNSHAFGRNSEKDTAVWGISFGGALIGGPAGAPFVGAFEVGFGIGCLIWSDPPDPDNAGISVILNDYLGYQMPNALDEYPTMNPSIASAIDVAMDDVDYLVALSRARRTALDRYEGALLIERQDWADDRWSEYISFGEQLYTAGIQSKGSLNNLIDVYNMVEPSILNTIVTKQGLKNLRDQVASGIFPSVDDLAISSWELSSDELSWLQDNAAALQDITIDNAFAAWDPVQGESTTLGFQLSYASNNIAGCCVPEPISSTLFIVGGATLGLRRFWKKRKTT